MGCVSSRSRVFPAENDPNEEIYDTAPEVWLGATGQYRSPGGTWLGEASGPRSPSDHRAFPRQSGLPLRSQSRSNNPSAPPEPPPSYSEITEVRRPPFSHLFASPATTPRLDSSGSWSLRLPLDMTEHDSSMEQMPDTPPHHQPTGRLTETSDRLTGTSDRLTGTTDRPTNATDQMTSTSDQLPDTSDQLTSATDQVADTTNSPVPLPSEPLPRHENPYCLRPVLTYPVPGSPVAPFQMVNPWMAQYPYHPYHNAPFTAVPPGSPLQSTPWVIVPNMMPGNLRGWLPPTTLSSLSGLGTTNLPPRLPPLRQRKHRRHKQRSHRLARDQPHLQGSAETPSTA